LLSDTGCGRPWLNTSLFYALFSKTERGLFDAYLRSFKKQTEYLYMTAKELLNDVLTKAKDFGLIAKNEGRTIIDPKGNAVIRDNLDTSAFTDGSAFFALISNEEEPAGQVERRKG
jgi:hypothetical protein